MSYEVYRYIFLGGAILAAMMLVVSIVLFFTLKIPTVIGDLTGSNARKAIENIRKQNADTGPKTYRPSAVNRERGRVTDKISSSGTLMKNSTHSLHGSMETEKIQTQKMNLNDPAKETVVLDSAQQPLCNETSVLSGYAPLCAEETSVLSSTNNAPCFEIIQDITFVYSNEIIY